MKIVSSWNTWDVRCLNAVMKIPEMAEVRVGLYNTDTKFYKDEFLWNDVKRFGYHHIFGDYFNIELEFEGQTFSLQFAAIDDRFVYKVTPMDIKPLNRFYVSFLFRWGVKGYISNDGTSPLMGTKDREFRFRVFGKTDEKTLINVSHQGIAFYADSPVYICCNFDGCTDEMDSFLEKKRIECIETYVKGDGCLMDTPEAIIKGITWNTIYEPVYNRICTPVTRAWCINNGHGFGSYVLFEWDTFFNAIMCGIQDRQLALYQVNSILSEIAENGMIPNFAAERGNSVDRSQPPVGSYCVLKLYRQFNDLQFLETAYDRLLKWNSWWMKYRDGNGDGLLEWGSNPSPEKTDHIFISDNLQAAMYESGLDNSPMYDDVVFNKDTHTMELIDVGLNALYAMDCWALSEIASILGKEQDAEKLMQEYSRVKKLINEFLWDEVTGIYLNRYWDGRYSSRLSPTNFYPLIAGIASREQAERMIKEHLLNENEFWGEYVIPSISRNDEAFGDNSYWRGRIWGPMNFLVAEGIKRYGFYNEAYAFASKSLKLFRKGWENGNRIYENYNAVTGEGSDVKNSDPVYTWGGLLGYLGVSELVEAQPWAGIRFGNLNGEKCAVKNYPVENGLYNVYMDGNLIVERNSKKIIESDVPVIILNYSVNNGKLSFSILADKPGTVHVYPWDGIDSISFLLQFIV